MPSSVQLELWGGLKALPWIIKPVYGILSDAMPLLGYHRRSYLILFGLLGKLHLVKLKCKEFRCLAQDLPGCEVMSHG